MSISKIFKKVFSISNSSDKKHKIIYLAGLKISLKSFNIMLFYRFMNKKVRKKTILIIEAGDCHFETMTGLCNYCSELGYNVDILTYQPTGNIFTNFKIKTLLRVYECNSKTFDEIYNKYDFSKYERIIYNSKRKYCKNNIISLDGYDLSEYYNFVQKGQKDNIYLQHHIDKYDETPNDIQIILANPSNRPNLNKFVVNSHYFKELKTKIKNRNKIINFNSIGELSKKRRNSSLLIDAIKALHKNGMRNFMVTIIGRGKLDELPKEIKQYFNILGRVDYQTMFKEIEKADFILPLLDPDIEAHKRYMNSGTSGSFQLIYGFNKPCIIHKIFADIYDFDETNSLIYKNNALFSETLKNAINIDADEYLKLQKHLIEKTDKITASSMNNLKNILAN